MGGPSVRVQCAALFNNKCPFTPGVPDSRAPKMVATTLSASYAGLSVRRMMVRRVRSARPAMRTRLALAPRASSDGLPNDPTVEAAEALTASFKDLVDFKNPNFGKRGEPL